MDKFDFEEETVESPPRRLSILDLFTCLVVLATLAIGAFLVYVFINPKTPLNPLYPKVPTAFLLPTSTLTPVQMQPTWTATLVLATESPTLVPTFTLQPSMTPISLAPPTKTPPATATPKAPYSATVSAIQSTIIHPDLGCGWFGVGGSVVGADNAPVLYMTLHLFGSLNEQPVEQVTVSGTKLDYGQSGFEFQLGTTPLASNKLLTLQLLDQSGNPQSDDVHIITYNDCNKNLILVRFKKNP
jgi:hypothetical protein